MTVAGHIAVLVADTPIAGVAERHGDFGDNCRALLAQGGCRTPVRCYQVCGDNVEEAYCQLEASWDAGEVHGVLVTGLRADSFATDVAWITRLAAFLRRVLGSRVPLVGVCFGHQLVARLLGCKVGRNAPEHGLECGTTTIELNRDIFEVADSPFATTLVAEGARVYDHLNVIESHQDVVYGMPPPASCDALGTSFVCLGLLPKCANQGIVTAEGRVKVLTFQGHPEFLAAEALDMLHDDLARGIIDRHQYEKSCYATKLLNNQGPVIARAIAEFFRIHAPCNQ